MTPYEFRLYVEAHDDKREQFLRDLAWHSCNIANVWLKPSQRMKPEKLVRPRGSASAIKLGSGPGGRMRAAEHNKRIRNRQAVRALLQMVADG